MISLTKRVGVVIDSLLKIRSPIDLKKFRYHCQSRLGPISVACSYGAFFRCQKVGTKEVSKKAENKAFRRREAFPSAKNSNTRHCLLFRTPLKIHSSTLIETEGTR